MLFSTNNFSVCLFFLEFLCRPFPTLVWQCPGKWWYLYKVPYISLWYYGSFAIIIPISLYKRRTDMTCLHLDRLVSVSLFCYVLLCYVYVFQTSGLPNKISSIPETQMRWAMVCSSSLSRNTFFFSNANSLLVLNFVGTKYCAKLRRGEGGKNAQYLVPKTLLRVRVRNN